MASRNKKTTFAKLKREQDIRERRALKDARRAARKELAANPQPEIDETAGDDEPTGEEEEAPEESALDQSVVARS